MNSTQLSMFSDNIPDKDLEKNNLKKKKSSGPLGQNTSNNDSLSQTLLSEKGHESITKIIEPEPVIIEDKVNNPEKIDIVAGVSKNNNNLPFHASDLTQAGKNEYNSPKGAPVSFNSEVELRQQDSPVGIPEGILKTNKKNIKKEILELSDEDIKIQKIDTEIKDKGKLTDKDRLEYFEEIKAISLGCHKCRLSETRTKVVFGVGNSNAPIMIIGEGPGDQEDKTGIPFVGRAGQLLDKIIGSASIHRDTDIYITNVVKCRPPENRIPLQDEVEACSIYLEKQLELAKASIILLTGATAMKAILNSSSPISRIRGEWIEWKGKWVMPIFHPSYLLRNQSKEVGSPKWLMWQDIKKVKLKFDELKGK